MSLPPRESWIIPYDLCIIPYLILFYPSRIMQCRRCVFPFLRENSGISCAICILSLSWSYFIPAELCIVANVYVHSSMWIMEYPGRFV